MVYVPETRPLLQGSRLTAWELGQAGIPHRVIVDSAAAGLLLGGGVQAVVVGADRIAANGDVANKVGTLSHALAARHAGVPFVVAAPESTIDLRHRIRGRHRDRDPRCRRGARAGRPAGGRARQRRAGIRPSTSPRPS